MTDEEIENEMQKMFNEEYIPISFIEEIIHRDICLVYRGCLLMLLEKWRDANDE